MTKVPVDYAREYFEYPVFDKIHGETAGEALRYLKKQLKANSRTVISELGGQKHRHLGLVEYPIEYDLLSNEHYVSPVHPVLMFTPKGTTHHDYMCLIEEHGEDIRLFRENIEVEKSPIKQIVAVLGKDYLKELCNLGTETIIIYIPQVLVNLVTAYGMVYLDVLYIKETKFRSLF